MLTVTKCYHCGKQISAETIAEIEAIISMYEKTNDEDEIPTTYEVSCPLERVRI